MKGYSIIRKSKINGDKVIVKRDATVEYFNHLIDEAKKRELLTVCYASMTQFETEKFVFKLEYLPEFDFFDTDIFA